MDRRGLQRDVGLGEAGGLAGDSVQLQALDGLRRCVHAQHAGGGERGRRVDPGDGASRDGAGDEVGVGEAVGDVVTGVLGRAGDLQPAVDAVGLSSYGGTGHRGSF
jgi:hypothetical protein